MQTFASIFVSLVVIANTVFPKADIPKVLGVQIAVSGSGSEEIKVESSSDSRSEDTEDPKTSEQESSTTESSGETNSSSSKDFFEKSREAFKKSQERIRKTLEIKNESETETEVEDEDEGSQVNLKKREEFKTKLGEIRDEKKKEKLTNLDENLSKVNANAVSRWNKVLERLEAIIAKIKTRTDEASAQGRDVTGILSAISTAEGKITDAKTAVADQSNNAYVIVIGSESNLGQSVKSTISTLKTDLKAVETKVKAARDAVKDVFTALKAVVGTTEPTPSAVPTP